MKKLLLILLCLPFIGFGQQTYVPDDNFENYLEANGMGDGVPLNNYVLTVNINSVLNLQINGLNISSLIGVEDFSALSSLRCYNNQLDSLDLSANTTLTELDCSDNQLSSLSFSSSPSPDLEFLYCRNNLLTSLNVNAPALEELYCNSNLLTNLNVYGSPDLFVYDCSNNQLTSLDLSNINSIQALYCKNNQLTSLDVQSVDVRELWCQYNQLSALDVSGVSYLSALNVQDNQLTTLDIRNMGNIVSNMVFNTLNNPNLTCINIDSNLIQQATLGWNNTTDPQNYFSNNCPPSAIQEHTTNKQLLKVTDLLGRETKHTNQPLFYIYNDGTVEKRIVIE